MYIRFQRYTPSGAIQKSLSISITNQGVQALTSEIGQIGMAPLCSFGYIGNRNICKKNTRYD